MMKRILLFLLVTLSLLTACSKEEDMSDYEGPGKEMSGKTYKTIATVRVSDKGTLYLQVDESLRLCPLKLNVPAAARVAYPDEPAYGQPYKIICEFRVLDQWCDELKCYYVTLSWLSRLDEGFVTSQPTGGDDPVEIIDDWMTCLTDGFLTLHYYAWWGNTTRHAFTLLTGQNPSDPYELVLKHNAQGDPRTYFDESIITFYLEKKLPVPANPKTTYITLKWTSETGETYTKQFPYWKRN